MKKWLLHPIKRRLAKYYLLFLRKFFGLKVIGITGSAGKTSTKDMLASILRLKGKTVASYANIDPVYNIPSTILRANPFTKYLVLEMGVEYPGEMDFYLWLATPDIGVITNIYPTHTEFFKNENGVFDEKKKLAYGISKDGVVILNSGDPRLAGLAGKVKSKVVWFGRDDIPSASNNKITLKIDKSNINVQLPVVGNQFVQNALTAAKCGWILGVSNEQIRIGLETFTPPPHRMASFTHKSGALILDDSYNSNPQAVKEGLSTFNSFAQNRKKIVVIGDMLELGDLEEKYHREIGRLIGKMDISLLIGVGIASKLLTQEASLGLGAQKVKWAKSEKNVFSMLKPYLKAKSAVFIKGSRSVHLDRVVARLTK